ncbi:hypothetical protein IM40_04745 [Candidatus Paracaedimonas acanthamoebae]|nr:hypothetical protein IM40_04745 [Candidatus Paracaedimonas acanthamoebae]
MKFYEYQHDNSGLTMTTTHKQSSQETLRHTTTLAPIPRLVWTLGWMMFLVNLSFIMVYSYIGIYMKSLGVTMAWIGVVEGVAEGCSYLMKLLSGMFSDYLRRRKPVMLVGYTMLVISRVIFSLAASFIPLFGARLVERLGNGIQSTPRDTMVADISPANRIGASYGLKRTLAQSGSLLGAVAGIGAMIWMGGDYQKVFQLAAVPAFIAFLILILFVHEPKKFAHSAVSSEIPLPEQKNRSRMHWSNLPALGSSFWLLMLVAAIFMLSRFSETFLTLHAYNNFGLQSEYAPTIMLIFNAGWCLSSYPVGVLADRMNRYWFLAMGIVFLILADHFLATANSLIWVYVGCFFWGVQYGVTQNIFLSLIAEIVPADLRGTGFGCYYIICAISAYFADHLAGVISEYYGQVSAFSFSGIIATVSLLVLIIVLGYKNNRKKKIL